MASNAHVQAAVPQGRDVRRWDVAEASMCSKPPTPPRPTRLRIDGQREVALDDHFVLVAPANDLVLQVGSSVMVWRGSRSACPTQEPLLAPGLKVTVEPVPPQAQNEWRPTSVSEREDGTPLVHCHAGCDQRTAWQAVLVEFI